MAVSVALLNDDLHVPRSHKRDTLLPRTGVTGDSHHQHGLRSRIKVLVGLYEQLRKCNPSQRLVNDEDYSEARRGHEGSEYRKRELFRPYETTLRIAVPPKYEEALLDLPPDYSNTELLATTQLSEDASHHDKAVTYGGQQHRTSTALFLDVQPKVDFSDVEGIRMVANKKTKQAAKKAQMDKWADSDNEDGTAGGADGGDGGDNNGGGDGASGAGGDGGDPPGGDDGDDWFTYPGASKKDKKKKKKNAWQDEDESEQKAEDEAKKAEEEAAVAANVAPEADAMDDFGGFASVKTKKKGKKGKAEPDPLPPPEPEPEPAEDSFDLGASAIADANGEDEWGGFATAKTAKKKTKKDKVCCIPFLIALVCWSCDDNDARGYQLCAHATSHTRNAQTLSITPHRGTGKENHDLRSCKMHESHVYPRTAAGKEVLRCGLQSSGLRNLKLNLHPGAYVDAAPLTAI